MESKVRVIAKAVTWQALGLLSMTLIGYFVTGSATQGGLVAVDRGGQRLCLLYPARGAVEPGAVGA